MTTKKLKKTKKTALWLEVEFKPKQTDPDSLANALDRLLETALSTPGIMEEYGDPHFGPCWVAGAENPGHRHDRGGRNTASQLVLPSELPRETLEDIVSRIETVTS